MILGILTVAAVCAIVILFVDEVAERQVGK
jgi:hypothetical protein